jgi:cation diffusion facilitator CzcD-associated flavoprotein CzcO
MLLRQRPLLSLVCAGAFGVAGHAAHSQQAEAQLSQTRARRAQRVAVIGAGAGGLISAKVLTEHGIACKVFEKREKAGGTWILDPSGGESSMFNSVLTNLPVEVMQMHDFPFPADLPSFVHHSVVLQYLHAYAKAFDLERLISYSTAVNRVNVLRTSDGEKFEVITGEGNDNEVFDAVMVCNGHYSDPSSPVIPGMESFPGEVSHSHSYREPSRFKGQTVAVLGAAASAQDISKEIARAGGRVLLSHHGNAAVETKPEDAQVLGDPSSRARRGSRLTLFAFACVPSSHA